jgi:hypothetical protein
MIPRPPRCWFRRRPAPSPTMKARTWFVAPKDWKPLLLTNEKEVEA